jgi:uncharacterized membrane protein
MQTLKDLKISKFGQLLKRHFLAGLFIVLPIGVIGWIIGSVFGLLWKLPYLLPTNLQPENIFFDHETIILLFNFLVTIIATLTLALGVSFVGWVSKQYIGRKLLDLLAEVISHIPVIRSVYSALDQLLKTLASSDGGQFSRVVYIEYPRKGTWALAFVTGAARGPNVPEKHLNVYIPTTPNPTSGFHLLVPESEVRESHLSVEEAFKTILSLGLAQSEPVRPGSR